jgi:hypothetical protein
MMGMDMTFTMVTTGIMNTQFILAKEVQVEHLSHFVLFAPSFAALSLLLIG